MTTTEIFVRLMLALALGALVGVEREWRGNVAGIRTNAIVCLGSALIMILNIRLFEMYSDQQIDITRMAAQVVSGIGFLGAGTIIRSGSNVTGLTTAASLWAVAAIGMCAGSGFFKEAVFTTVIVVVGLTLFRRVSIMLKTKSRETES